MRLLISHVFCVCLILSCASLGLVVIKEGSPIADRVCGKPAPNPVTAMPETPSSMSQSVLSSIFTSVSTPGLQSNSQNPDTSLASETTATIPDTPYTMTPSPSSTIHKRETIQPDNATHPTSNQSSATLLASETTSSGRHAEVAATLRGPSMYANVTYFILFSRYFSHPC